MPRWSAHRQHRTRQLPRWALISGCLGTLVAGGLVAPPAALSGEAYGLLIDAQITPQVWLPGPLTHIFEVEFRAQAAMVASDVVIRRTGNSVIVLEQEGGPSLGVAPEATLCKGNNPAGLSSEVVCTFPTAAAGPAGSPRPVEPAVSDWVAGGDFSAAPRGASFIIEEGSAIRGFFIGSPFQDYFQGGDLRDTASGGAGPDNLYGGDGPDSLWGDAGADDIEGEGADDRIEGGTEADSIVGGAGSDSIVGGEGPDSISARDRTADTIHCGNPYGPAAGAGGDTLEYDAALDSAVGCGTVEWPRAIINPTVSTQSVKVGETITGTRGEWTGTTPILYTYTFERCPVDPESTLPCTIVKRGSLDSKGLDQGKPPSYTATRADQGRRLTFRVAAANERTAGGGTTVASASTMPVAPPANFTILGAWLPKKQGSSWTFTNAWSIQEAILNSGVGPFVNITLSAQNLRRVPKEYQKVVGHGATLAMTVNGKPLSAGDNVKVEGAPDERASVVITYYSFAEDRRKCQLSDDGIVWLQRFTQGGGMPLDALLTYVNGSGQCPWVIDWSNEVSRQNTFMATGIELEATGDPEQPVQLRITAAEPSADARLSVVVGAPPNSYVSAMPEAFSLTPDARFVAFPNRAYSAVLVGLLGDQVRQSSKYGVADLYVDGKLVYSESFKGQTSLGAPFSTVVGHAFSKPGKARIVVSTLADTPGANRYVTGQAFVDIDIVTPSDLDRDYLVTWDGRCFDETGVPERCIGQNPPELRAMRDALSEASGKVIRYRVAWDALRYASETLDLRFVAVAANGSLGRSPASASTRYRECWFIDLLCHASNMLEGVGNALASGQASQGRPKPKPQYYQVRIKVILVGGDTVAGGVLGEGIIEFSQAGLINLDGGTLINLDGGTLTRRLGASLLGKVKLINLDGGTFNGIDNASIISDMGGALIGRGSGQVPVAVLSLQQVTTP